MLVLDQAGESLYLPFYRGQVGKPPQDQPFFVDDHGRASPVGRVGQVTFFPGCRHAIGDGDGPVTVEYHWERQTFFLHPGADGFLVPVVYSEDLDVLSHEVCIIVTVPVTVAGSIASARGREKPQPDLLAP